MAATLGKLTIYPPQSSIAGWQVHADDVQFEFQLQYAATATLTILTGWETYFDESDANSPIQLNAYVTYEEDGVFIFRGNIFSITRTIQDGVPGIIVDCLDKLRILKDTYCATATGSYIMRDQTPLQALATQQLYQGEQYTGLEYQYVYYPAFDSAAWLAEASCTDFTVIDSMPNNSTDIAELVVGAAAAGGYPGIPPAGFFSVGTEWCQYNGLQYNQAAAAGLEWTMLNVRRAMLGSTAAAHSANAGAHSRLSKRIACEGTVLIEGVYSDDAVNTPIPDRHYQINYEDGSFVFGVDPLALRYTPHFDNLVCSYSVYNEDGGSELVLSDVVVTLLDSDDDYGGPEIPATPSATAPGYSITLSPDPVIARYVIEEPTTVDDAIRRFLFELGLNKGTDNDLIGYLYNSADDQIHLDTLAQKAAGSPDRRYHGERARTEEMTMDDVLSGVIAWYSDGGGMNLCAGTRFIHPTLGLSPGGTKPWAYLKEQGVWTPAAATYPSPNNATFSKGVCVITDNDSSSGMAMGWATDPSSWGTAYRAFWAWFPGATDAVPATWNVSKISVTLELIGTIAGPMEITIEHIPDYDYGTGFPFGTPTPISPSLTQIYGVAENGDGSHGTYPAGIKQDTMTLQADGLNLPTKCICIKVRNLVSDVTNLGSAPFGLKILDIYVEGSQRKSELIKLAAAYNASATNLLVAPLSEAKIHDANTAQHHVGVLDLGTATREVAMNLAWLQLLQSLALSQSRVYTIDSTALESAGIPLVGETIEMSDGFAGLVDNIRYQVSSGGARSLEVRLINYLTTLFGMSI